MFFFYKFKVKGTKSLMLGLFFMDFFNEFCLDKLDDFRFLITLKLLLESLLPNEFILLKESRIDFYSLYTYFSKLVAIFKVGTSIILLSEFLVSNFDFGKGVCGEFN